MPYGKKSIFRSGSRRKRPRSGIKQRQAEGIAAAKARGVKFGRPPLPIPDNFGKLIEDWRAGKITIEEAAEACGMCAKTFYSEAVKFEKC